MTPQEQLNREVGWVQEIIQVFCGLMLNVLGRLGYDEHTAATLLRAAMSQELRRAAELDRPKS